jgi:hypothetical protein
MQQAAAAARPPTQCEAVQLLAVIAAGRVEGALELEPQARRGLDGQQHQGQVGGRVAGRAHEERVLARCLALARRALQQ